MSFVHQRCKCVFDADLPDFVCTMPPDSPAHMSAEDPYEYFWQSDSPFSQWHMATFELDGVTYNCAEQGMMHVRVWRRVCLLRECVGSVDVEGPTSRGLLVITLDMCVVTKWSRSSSGADSSAASAVTGRFRRVI